MDWFNGLSIEPINSFCEHTYMNLYDAKLNHISFPTHDVASEAHFFEHHLGATLEFIEPASGSALLRHGNIDIVLEKKLAEVTWHKDFHFGFELATKREVDALYETFKHDGIALESEVFNRLGRGSRFFARTPGGVQIEVNTREDREDKWDASKNGERNK